MAKPPSIVVSSSVGVKLDVCVFSAEEHQASGRQEAQPSTSSSVALPVVLVHQYSILGGNQGLMKGMAKRLARRGHSCVTFDMRGVGNSTGKASLTGGPEVDDVVAVCKWTAQYFKAPHILLVGSSAGAPIAGSAVDKVEEVVGYVGVGYTFGAWASILFGRHFDRILQSEKPKLFIMGTRDGFTSVSQLEKKLQKAKGKALKHLVPDIGHFELEGPHYDDLMVDLISRFAAEHLAPTNQTSQLTNHQED